MKEIYLEINVNPKKLNRQLAVYVMEILKKTYGLKRFFVRNYWRTWAVTITGIGKPIK